MVAAVRVVTIQDASAHHKTIEKSSDPLGGCQTQIENTDSDSNERTGSYDCEPDAELAA